MAQRIPELSFARTGPSVDVETDQLLTPELVDSAVERVLDGYPEAVQENFRNVWATDETSEVSRMLQQAIVARQSRLRSYADAARRPVTVRYSLTAEEQRSVVSRYPDMDVRFLSHVRHDHPLAATDRLLSSIKLHGRVPTGLRYVDFGGSIVMHVEQGNADVLVVGGLHDGKDGSRQTLAQMRLRMLASDPGVSEVTRTMAASVLAGEGKYFQEGSLQTYNGDARVGVMSHVYDVPVIEIPRMMKRTKMLLFEGILHFSSRFFFETEGKLESVGARFQIVDGKFKMGFVDSPSHWYVHDWAEFSKYGCDREIVVDGAAYSYKVVENRGDTIAFRVLPLASAKASTTSFVARPGVPMVAVDSYEHRGRSARAAGSLTAKTRLYPEDIWNSMVRAAVTSASKGRLDFNEHLGEYKSLVAGHKYNGVSTVSALVETSDVPWLAVDSAVFAMTTLAIIKRSTKAFTTDELERRVLSSRGVGALLFKSFVESIKRVLGLVSGPIVAFMDFLIAGMSESLDVLIEVNALARHIRVDSATIVLGGSHKHMVQHDDFPLREFVEREQALNEYVKQVVEAGNEQAKAAPKSSGYDITAEGTTLAGSSVPARSALIDVTAVGKPDWVPLVNDGVVVEDYHRSDDYHTAEQMRDAVSETAKAVRAEAKQLEAWCEVAFSKYAGGRTPSKEDVAVVREQYRNFDFWRVNSGVLQDTSLLGTERSSFSYSGVYCPVEQEVVQPGGGVEFTRLIPVVETVYSDQVRQIFRTHYVMAAEYTGWVMVSDGFRVMNGPHVAAGVRIAMDKPMDFEMAGMVGGPGCGKTTAILNNFKPGDMVITPLRLSAKDVREKLVEAGKLTKASAQKVVRTIDSILVQVGRDQGLTRELSKGVFMVHVDECFNTNAGRVYAALALLGAKRCMAYGDRNQIEHVVRADLSLLYPAMSFPHVVTRHTVFRSSAEILACFSKHYGDRLRTARKESGSVWVRKGVFPVVGPNENVMLLVMNQASKPVLAKHYPAHKHRISTVHEAQGGEADKVLLFNFEPRKVGPENPTYLYNQPRYVNVAISRARFEFGYIRISDYSDVVIEWIGRGSNPSLIAGVKDLSTAGKPVDF